MKWFFRILFYTALVGLVTATCRNTKSWHRGENRRAFGDTGLEKASQLLSGEDVTEAAESRAHDICQSVAKFRPSNALQTVLGLMTLWGIGASPDVGDGLRRLTSAADGGFAPAAAHLGDHFLYKKMFDKAVPFYGRAGKAGNVRGQELSRRLSARAIGKPILDGYCGVGERRDAAESEAKAIVAADCLALGIGADVDWLRARFAYGRLASSGVKCVRHFAALALPRSLTYDFVSLQTYVASEGGVRRSFTEEWARQTDEFRITEEAVRSARRAILLELIAVARGQSALPSFRPPVVHRGRSAGEVSP